MVDLVGLHYWLVQVAYRASVAAAAKHPTLCSMALASPYVIEALLAAWVLSVQYFGMRQLKRIFWGPSVLMQAREILGQQIERYEASEFALPDGRRVKPKFDEHTGEQKSLEFVHPKPPALPPTGAHRPLRVKSGRETLAEIPFHHKHYEG